RHDERVTKHAANPLDDRQAETESTLLLATRTRAAIELLEHTVEFLLVNARSRVPDADGYLVTARARGEQNTAALGVLDRVREQIAQHAQKQQLIRVDSKTAATHPQRQTLCSRLRHELLLERAEHLVEEHLLDARLDRTGVEPRDLEQFLHQLGERFHRRRQIGHQGLDRALRALAQQRHIDADRLQRLAQVVARRGEELRLRSPGGFGVAAGG